jgi:hypothetical protein
MFLFSCSSSSTVENKKEKLPEGYIWYFPNKEVGNKLEEISESIKLINNLTFYKVYSFPKGEITNKELGQKGLLEKALAVSTISQTSSGTATIISVSSTKVALLTAAHIISYPDTIVNYFSNNGIETKFIESVLIKERQKIYSDLPGGGLLRNIAKDDKNDIAIVGNSFRHVTPIEFHPLMYKLGNAKELKWGSFVYIFGFPVHNKMVTHAIVSNPDFDGEGAFFIDAVINRGASGGLILAIRGSVPNFEIVGIVSAVPAERNYVLTPNKTSANENFILGESYEGKMTVEQINFLKYGVSRVVPVEKIREFIKKYDKKMKEQGYVIDLN